MQKVEAKLEPEAYANVKILWRGMKDRSMDIEVRYYISIIYTTYY